MNNSSSSVTINRIAQLYLIDCEWHRYDRTSIQSQSALRHSQKKKGRIDYKSPACRNKIRAWNGLSALLLQMHVDAFAQLFAWLEMRNVLAGQCNRIAGLGIATHTWRTVMQRKAAETAYFDTLAGGQA
jgi:hypothetical protein